MALRGVQVGTQHAQEHQRGQELDHQEEGQVGQTHPELDRAPLQLHGVKICKVLALILEMRPRLPRSK